MDTIEKINDILNEDNNGITIRKLKDLLRKINGRKYQSDNISEILHIISLENMLVSSFLEKNPKKQKRSISKVLSFLKV